MKSKILEILDEEEIQEKKIKKIIKIKEIEFENDVEAYAVEVSSAIESGFEVGVEVDVQVEVEF